MRAFKVVTATLLLAVVGFIVGRWVASMSPVVESRGGLPFSAEAERTQAEALESLLEPSPVAGGELRWIKQILSGDIDALELELMAMDEVERTSTCLALIARMDATMMRALVDRYFGGASAEVFKAWFDATGDLVPLAFAERWAELDPQGLGAYARERLAADPEPGEGDDLSSAQAIAFAAVMGLSKSDPELALELAEASKGEMADFSMALAIGALAGSDPERAVALMHAQGVDASEVFSSLSPAQAEAAIPTVLALEDEGERDRILSAIIFSWAKRDPVEAFAAAREAKNASAIETAVREWTSRDPQAASESLNEVSAKERGALSQLVAKTWSQTDPVAAHEWAELNLDEQGFDHFFQSNQQNLPPELAIRYFKITEDESYYDSNNPFSRYAQTDPEAAFAWLSKQAPETVEGIKSLSSSAGVNLALLGTEVASKTLLSIPPGEFRTGSIRSALEFIGYDDPAGAQAMALSLGGEERAAAINGLILGWVEREPRAAVEFAQAQSDQIATDTAFTRWSMMDPVAAHDWLLETAGDQPAAIAETVRSTGMAATWAYRDPAKAGAAMLALPPGDAAQEVAKVVEIWAWGEPLEASAFINENLEPGVIRDQAVAALVRQIRAQDPDSASDWAASIIDPALRAEVTGEE